MVLQKNLIFKINKLTYCISQNIKLTLYAIHQQINISLLLHNNLNASQLISILYVRQNVVQDINQELQIHVSVKIKNISLRLVWIRHCSFIAYKTLTNRLKNFISKFVNHRLQTVLYYMVVSINCCKYSMHQE